MLLDTNLVYPEMHGLRASVHRRGALLMPCVPRTRAMSTRAHRACRARADNAPPGDSSAAQTVRNAAAAVLLAAAVFVSPASLPIPYAIEQAAYAATDNAEVGKCVLGNCQKALAGCLADPTCVENLICLQSCNGKDNETECQIKCGTCSSDRTRDSRLETRVSSGSRFVLCATTRRPVATHSNQAHSLRSFSLRYNLLQVINIRTRRLTRSTSVR